jgi:(S)-citramalyl-CoA lyase
MAGDLARPQRSWLFTPATRPDRFAKAAAVGADVLILDLEDSVAPADKARARATAMSHVGAVRDVRTAVRVNGLDTRAGIDDLHELLASQADADFIVLPKTEGASHVCILDRLLRESRKRSAIVALVESVRGLAAIDAIADATPRLAGVMFGAGDMAADLGALPAWEPLLHARSRIVAACARAGVLSIDSPFFEIRDASGLEDEIARSRALGFVAKAAIHPAQIEPVRRAFTPPPDAVAHARAILSANRAGVGVVDGQMIDEAMARQARRTLAAAGLEP